MSELVEIINGLIEKHDAFREVYFSDDTRCLLLSGDGETTPFQLNVELLAGWYLKYSKFRSRLELLYATHDTKFAKTLSLSGYVAIGGDIYEIDDGDTVPPQGEEPFWRIPAKRTGGKKFVPPA